NKQAQKVLEENFLDHWAMQYNDDGVWQVSADEAQLQKHAEPAPSDSSLGADSLVARLLIGYAATMIEHGDHTHVVIATDDGGIALDVKRLRQESGLPIFVLAPDEEASQTDPFPEILEYVKEKRMQAKRRGKWITAAWSAGLLAVAAAMVLGAIQYSPMITLSVLGLALILFGPALLELVLQRREGRF
ncbi:MAG: hypothetical protein N2C14_10240, partial [Planctomycetales bacterium]